MKIAEATMETPEMNTVCDALRMQAQKTAVYVHAHRGESLTPPADRIVQDCLRQLQAIRPADRMGADILMDKIARIYLDTAYGVKETKLRAEALLRITGAR